MSEPIRLPSRYEDLDQAFRGRLRPVQPLIRLVKQAAASMSVTGGIRFIPIYGQSGSGKTCAAQELATHLPETEVFTLSREAIESPLMLDSVIHEQWNKPRPPKLLIAVIDQYEESVARRGDVPTQFVESLSLLDRSDLRHNPTLFIWLTTSRKFQTQLADATSRNERILTAPTFEVSGPERDEWPGIIEETFEFHNRSKPLADFSVLADDLDEVSYASGTIGQAIGEVGRRLGAHVDELHDISEYQVVMLWPVTGTRIDRVAGFTNVLDGYKLDWGTWYRSFGEADRAGLPFDAYNRARLYFDMRLVPIAVADLHRLCLNLDDDEATLPRSNLTRLSLSHFFSVVDGTFDFASVSRMRARESKRASAASDWYSTVTDQPTALGKRIARCLRELQLEAQHEVTINAGAATCRADILVRRRPEILKETSAAPNVLVELKAYSTANTMPATIRDAVKGTLRKYAQFASFLERQ